MGVKRGHEQAIAENGEAAIDGATTGLDFGEAALVTPNDLAGAGVEGEGMIVRAGAVHDAVNDERSGFELSHVPDLEDPFESELGGVGVVDLCQGAVAPTLVSAGVGEPVLRL